VQGELWARMNAQSRNRAAFLSRRDVPEQPGVYAWYRDDAPVYIGRSGDHEIDRLRTVRQLRGRATNQCSCKRSQRETSHSIQQMPVARVSDHPKLAPQATIV